MKHSMILFECYYCNFKFHLVLELEVFEVLVETECIHLEVHRFLMFHLKGYLEGMKSFLFMYVYLLILVLGK